MTVPRRRALLVGALLASGLAGVVNDAWAAQPKALLDSTRSECLSAQSNVQARLDRAQMWNGLIAILGAGVAAAASVFAGFSKRDDKWRQRSAVVGVMGAMVPLVPQVLPNTEALRKQLQAADRHLLAGEKVFIQLEDTQYEKARVEFRKYAKARFVECRSSSPSDQVPDLPKVVITDPGELHPAMGLVEQPAEAVQPAASARTRLVVEAARPTKTPQPEPAPTITLAVSGNAPASLPPRTVVVTAAQKIIVSPTHAGKATSSKVKERR